MMSNSQLERDVRYTLNCLSEAERKKLQGATVLITGACGFLGYYFLHFFKDAGRELGIERIIALDNFMLGKPDWVSGLEHNDLFDIQQFDIISGDVCQIKGADRAEYIIHMASIASPSYYRKYPIETLDANVWGLRRLLDFYKGQNIKGFLYFSSSEIYGDPDTLHIPTREDYNGNVSAIGPRACYDESKRFGETLCMLFARQHNMPAVVARPFNNYGPGMKLTDARVPADFARAVLEGRDIEILSNGAPTRTFCYVADAVAGYLKALLYGRYDYFNIGIERPEIAVHDLARYYAEAGREIFGYIGQIIYANSGDPQYLTDNPQRRCPDIGKARSVLGYAPTIEVREGVERFLKYLKEDQHVR